MSDLLSVIVLAFIGLNGLHWGINAKKLAEKKSTKNDELNQFGVYVGRIGGFGLFIISLYQLIFILSNP